MRRILKLPIFATADYMEVAVDEVCVDTESAFQKITIADTESFGRCLIINDVMQSCVTDKDIYNLELVKFASCTDKRVLILGGGDGFVAEELLKENPKMLIDVLDLDIEIVKYCEKYFNQEVFKRDTVHLIVGDALASTDLMCEKGNKYDGIICDLTDLPIGRDGEADFRDFYRKIIRNSSQLLNPQGWISLQAGASKTSGDYINARKIIKDFLTERFVNVTESHVFIPSFGEDCAFLFGQEVKSFIS